MTKKELEHVREVLHRIKEPSGKVQLAIAYVEKDLALRLSQKDAFKGDYEEAPW